MRALTESQVQRRGIEVRDSIDSLREVEQPGPGGAAAPATEYSFRDGRGHSWIMTPDPGWNYTPGRTGLGFPPPAGGGAASVPVLGAMIANQRTWRDYGLPAQLPISPHTPDRLPPAPDRDAARRQIIAALAVGGGRAPSFRRDDGRGDLDYGSIVTPAAVDDVRVTRSFVEHLLDRPGQREQFANYILPTLRVPAEIWSQFDRGGHDRLFVARYADLDAVAVVRDDKYGWLTWTFYASHKDIDHRRAGHLLYVREGD